LHARIKVPILDFENPEIPETQVLMVYNYYSDYDVIIPNGRFSIAWQYLPSVETLIECYIASNLDSSPSAGPFFGLHQSFRAFSQAYCRCPWELPLVSFLPLNSESLAYGSLARIDEKDNTPETTI